MGRMTNIKHELEKEDLGTEVLGKVAIIMQSKGMASAAAEMLKQAAQLLNSDNLPAIQVSVEGSGLRMLVNRQLVDGMDVVDVLGEALDLVEQSLDLWSRQERGQHSQAVCACITSMLSHATLAEECLTLEVLRLMAVHGADSFILEGPSEIAFWDAETATESFAALGAALEGASSDDEPLSLFFKRLAKFLGDAPIDIYSKEMAAHMIESIDLVCRNQAARRQLEEVLRLLSEVLSNWHHLSASAFFEEIKRCTSAVDMGQSLLSKAVCLQKAVDTLSTQTITAITLVDCYYELPVAEGATALVVVECPAYAPTLFDKLPTMVVLVQVETVMLGCLSMVFGEIAEATCITSLEVPSAVLPDDASAEELLKACIKCTEAIAKPANVWLQGDSPNDTAWPGSLSTELACNLLKVLASRGKTVGVAPLCTVTAVGEEAMVDDLSASGHVLNMFEVVGKIGRLIAWVKFYFCPARSTTSVAKDAVINASLAKALTAAGECVQEAKRMAAGATPTAVSSLDGLPWTFPIVQFEHCVNCAHTAHQKVCSDVITAAVSQSQLLDSSEALLKKVPPYQPHVAKPNVNLQQVANLLLTWPGKEALGAGCIALGPSAGGSERRIQSSHDMGAGRHLAGCSVSCSAGEPDRGQLHVRQKFVGSHHGV